MANRNRIARGVGFMGLAGALALSACSSDTNRTLSLTINRPPVAVWSALSDITFHDAGSEEAMASTLFPEADVSQTRPSDRELVYTVRGDKPEKAIRIHFTFEPAASGTATALKAELQVPDIVLTVRGVRKTIDASKVAALLGKDLDAIKAALDGGKPVGSSRREFAALLLGIAVANHQSAMNRALAYNSQPDSLARDVLARFGDGDAGLGDGGDAGGAGQAQGRSAAGNGAAAEPAHEAAPVDDGAGTEPKPVE